jgi:hypothetical protein
MYFLRPCTHWNFYKQNIDYQPVILLNCPQYDDTYIILLTTLAFPCLLALLAKTKIIWAHYDEFSSTLNSFKTSPNLKNEYHGCPACYDWSLWLENSDHLGTLWRILIHLKSIQNITQSGECIPWLPCLLRPFLIYFFRAEARTQAPLIPGPRGEVGSPHCQAHSSHALPAFCITNC